LFENLIHYRKKYIFNNVMVFIFLKRQVIISNNDKLCLDLLEAKLVLGDASNYLPNTLTKLPTIPSEQPHTILPIK